jgi:hypothetical protein
MCVRASRKKDILANIHRDFMPHRLEPPLLGNYNIVCPYCRVQNMQVIGGDYNRAKCPSCGKDWRLFVATVRAKRGRAKFGREYLIRTITRSGEGVLRFVDAGYSDLDLRSGDIFYVCYKI